MTVETAHYVWLGTSSFTSSILQRFCFVFWFFLHFSLNWLYFSPQLCSWWNVLEVVCKIGKFTIRDAILFHKFCIFNKEYFVFLAHRMFSGNYFFPYFHWLFKNTQNLSLWVFSYNFASNSKLLKQQSYRCSWHSGSSLTSLTLLDWAYSSK